MKRMKIAAKRLLLPAVLLTVLSGCAVQQTTAPDGYYVINPDGTRTYVQGAYTCPVGYTCTSEPGSSTTYVVPSAYFWPPLFFGMGYFFGAYSDGPHHYVGPPHRGGPHGGYPGPRR